MVLAICPNPSVDTFIWVEALQAGKVNRANKEQRFPGGKGVHVALACAEMGEQVTVLGFWGGPTGNWIRKECELYGVPSIGVEVQEWSRICQGFKADDEYDETEILGIGPTITPEQQNEFERMLERVLPGASCVSMSGSWPEGASPDAYARLIRICKKFGKPVFLDCTGDQLHYALRENPEVVHLNKSEARHIFGEMAPEALTERLKEHCSLSVVTAGKEGMYITDGRKNVHGKVQVDSCFSAVGSGDCLVAGLIKASGRSMDLEDTARLAVACGAANCLRKDLGMLYKDDVEVLLGRVDINPF